LKKIQCIQDNVTTLLKGLSEYDFKQCLQAWQKSW